MTNKIEKFNALAQSTVTSGNAKGEASNAHKGFHAHLSFLVLNVLASGNTTDIKHVVDSFAKDGGKFHANRMVLSRAKVVLKALNETGLVTIKNKKETASFTLDQVKGWNIENEPVFNVTGAANSITKALEPEEIKGLSFDEQALEHAASTAQISVKEVKSLVDCSALSMEQIRADYQIALDDKAKAETIENLPVLSETIRAQFATLQALAPNMAYDLLQSLSNHNEAKAA